MILLKYLDGRRISKHFMFKVHRLYIKRVFRHFRISKHFMFKVHAITKKILKVKTVFQNISCLRFIDGDTNLRASRTEFQNISCLRFIRRMLKHGSRS